MAQNVIIGGGVYGAAVAWALASRGAGCHLIEAKTIASGASGGPGRRGVRANGRDPREIPLIRRAHDLWPSLHETLGVPPLFERTGHLLLIERPDDLAEAEARAMMQDGMGIPCSMLSRDEVHDLEPGVSSKVLAAVYCPEDGVADHTATTGAYAAKAAEAGATIEEGAAATGLITDAGRVVAVETASGDRIPVEDNVLVLANSGVPSLVSEHVDLPVWSSPFLVLLSAPLDEVPVRHLVGHAHRILALKAEPGNRIMISGGRCGRWDQARQTGEPIAAEVEANVADAIATYPALDGLDIERADVGHLECLAIDHVPIIDRLPGHPNVYFATGWSGHGWAIAPAVAELLVQWVLDDERPHLLKPFALDRFTA